MIKIYKILLLPLYMAIIFSSSRAGDEEEISAVGHKRGHQAMENLTAHASEEQGEAPEIYQALQTGQPPLKKSRLDYDPAFTWSPSLLELPRNILDKILDHTFSISTNDELLQLRLVCSPFNDIVLALGQICLDLDGQKVVVAHKNIEDFNRLVKIINLNTDNTDKDETLLGEAYFALGELYFQGIFRSPDYQSALNCYGAASKYKIIKALVRQAQMYQQGLGVIKDEYLAQLIIETIESQVQHPALYAVKQTSRAFTTLTEIVRNVARLTLLFSKNLYYGFLPEQLIADNSTSNGSLYSRATDYDREFHRSNSLLGMPEEILEKILSYAFNDIPEKDILRICAVVPRFKSIRLPGGRFCVDNEGSYVFVADSNLADFTQLIEILKNNEDNNNKDKPLLAKAYFSLGELYLYGVFASPNFPKALKYLRQACKYNSQLAFARLAHLYQDGVGVLKNEYAAQLFMDKGGFLKNGKFHSRYDAYGRLPDTHYNVYMQLAEAHYKGSVLLQEKIRYLMAMKMFDLARQKGSFFANFFLGEMFYKGKVGAKNCSLALLFLNEFDDSIDAAFMLYSDICTSDEEFHDLNILQSKASYYLGKIYYAKNDAQRAFTYFKCCHLPIKAAFRIGMMYEEGTSDKGANTAKARKWYLEASKYGNKEAVARLKVMAEEGRAAQEVYRQGCANLKIAG